MSEQPKNSMKDDLFTFSFGVQRSIRYHIARRRYFDARHRTTLAIALIFGSAAIYTVLETTLGPGYTIAAAAVVTIATALDMVSRTSEKARLHHDLAKDFMRLEQEIVQTPNPAKKTFLKWKAQQIEIETREPPRMKVLNMLMRNELCLAMEIDEELKIGWIRRFFAHVVSINPDGVDYKESKRPQEPEVKNAGQLTPA